MYLFLSRSQYQDWLLEHELYCFAGVCSVDVNVKYNNNLQKGWSLILTWFLVMPRFLTRAQWSGGEYLPTPRACQLSLCPPVLPWHHPHYGRHLCAHHWHETAYQWALYKLAIACVLWKQRLKCIMWRWLEMELMFSSWQRP